MKKRMMIALIAAAMLLSCWLAGCGGENGTQSDTSDGASAVLDAASNTQSDTQSNTQSNTQSGTDAASDGSTDAANGSSDIGSSSGSESPDASGTSSEEASSMSGTPTEVSTPSESSKPSETSKSAETSKTAEASKTSETSKPTETSEPAEVEEVELHVTVYGTGTVSANGQSVSGTGAWDEATTGTIKMKKGVGSEVSLTPDNWKQLYSVKLNGQSLSRLYDSYLENNTWINILVIEELEPLTVTEPTELEVRYQPESGSDEWCRIVEERVVYYINLYRVEEGKGELQYLQRASEYCQYRCTQPGIIHDEHLMIEAATALKYGTLIDQDTEFGELLRSSIFIPEDCIGKGYYAPYGAGEAACNTGSGSIDGVAKGIADSFRGSAAHWAYVGDAAYDETVNFYIGVGVGNNKCYLVVGNEVMFAYE